MLILVLIPVLMLTLGATSGANPSATLVLPPGVNPRANSTAHLLLLLLLLTASLLD